MKKMSEREGYFEMTRGGGIFLLSLFVSELAHQRIVDLYGISDSEVVKYMFEHPHAWSGAEQTLVFSDLVGMGSLLYFFFGAGKGVWSWFRK